MAARLIDSLATTEELAELFSDESALQAMLDFEAALARAEAGLGIVPQAAAEKIALAAKAELFDSAALSRDTLRAGTPGIPLVKALTERVRATDPTAAGFVHWAATSQDVADTALVLLLKRAQSIFEVDLARLEKALRSLAEKHADTAMLGRTLMQAAPPITFGLKAAGWLGSIRRAHKRLNASFADALVVQFGGASGTLASLGDQGIAVGQALGDELGLAYPDAPWHTHRDRLAALLCDCGVLIGCLGKMARDISLLMQVEVAEAAEPGGAGRGGSSTMPHKRNPTGCSLALAAAYRVPGLVATFLSGMTQEHERGVGGWQAEWPTVAGLIQASGLAIASMVEVAEGLSVNSEKMRANVDATRGTIFAEKAMIMLGKELGRDAAHKLLEETTRKSVAESRHLSEVLRDTPEIAVRLDADALRDLENPEKYLGVADEFRKRLLSPKSKNPESERE
jgi:3-carboxy-cis,cis-muconate cycloisomerase